MTAVTRSVSPDTFIATGVRLLTPLIQEIYAVLVRVGILVIDD